MELRRIQYFIAVAEVEHFGRASQRLRIAQPALSRQVRLLEAEIGVELFERLPRGVRLTEAGRVLLAETRGVQAQLTRAIQAAQAAAAGRHGTLRLGFIEVVAWHGLVPDAIRTFRAGFPDIELTLAAMPTAGQLTALRQGQLDAALVYNPAPAEDLTAVPLLRHPALLAVPAGSPLAGQADVCLADLRDLPMIGFQRQGSPQFFDDLHMRFRQAGFSPRYVAEPLAETEILALVSAGTGVAVANSCQRWRPPHGVRFLPVRDLDVSLGLALVHRRDAVTPVLARFRDIMIRLTQASPAA